MLPSPSPGAYWRGWRRHGWGDAGPANSKTRGVGLVNNIRRAVAILALALYFCAY